VARSCWEPESNGTLVRDAVAGEAVSIAVIGDAAFPDLRIDGAGVLRPPNGGSAQNDRS